MINCYSAFYVRAIWSEHKQSILEASFSLADLLWNINRSTDGAFNTIYLLMNEGRQNVFYNLKDLTRSELQTKLADDILQRTEESIKKYNSDIKPSFEFSESIGFALHFYTDHQKSHQQFTIDLKIGAYNGWNNYIDLTFPKNFYESYRWYLSLLKLLLNHFPVTKGGVYPEFTTRLKGNPQEYPGWISYYNNHFDMPEIPLFIEVSEYEAEGKFYVLTTEDFNVKSSSHIEKWKDFYVKFLEKNSLPESQ